MTRPGRADAKTVALIASAVCALLFASIFGWSLLRSAGPEEVEGDDLLPPPDLRDLGTPRAGEAGSVRSADGLFIQFTDRDDPTRVAGVLEFDRLDPLRGRNYELTKPRAWFYLEDGRFVFVSAPAGRIARNLRDEVESGRFRDGVELRMYDPTPDGSRPDPETARPTLVGTTPILDFDFSISRASAPQRVEVISDEIEFVGHDATVVFHEIRRRIEHLRVERGERLVYRPRESEDATPVARAETPAPSPAPAAERAADGERVARAEPGDRPASEPRETERAQVAEQAGGQTGGQPAQARQPRRANYHIVASGDVLLTQSGRKISGDRMDLWLHTIDGKLPENTFGPTRAAAVPPDRTATASMPVHSAWTGPAAAQLPMLAMAVQESESPDTPVTDETLAVEPEAIAVETEAAEPEGTVTMTWSGPLVVNGLESRSDELRDGNQLAVRFTATSTGLVRMSDEGSGATARCSELFYYATRRELTLSGVGPRAVTFNAPGDGRLETTRLNAYLLDGQAVIPGPGLLHAYEEGQSAPNPARPQMITWTEQAEFNFAMLDGEMTSAIRNARFIGEVEARGRDAIGSSQMLVARFEADAERSRSRLMQLDMSERVSLEDIDRSRVTGDRLVIDFEQDPDREFASRPDRLTVAGSARVSQPDASLAAETIDARLKPEGEGRFALDRLVATENVEVVRRDDNSRALADRLTADAGMDRIELEGAPVRLTRGDALVEGPWVTYRREARLAEVIGRGRFVQQPRGSGEPAAEATWTEQMVYAGDEGLLSCFGDAAVVYRTARQTTETLQGEQIHVTLSRAEGESRQEDPFAFRSAGSSRQVQTVHAIGRAASESGGAMAVAQSLRVGAGPLPRPRHWPESSPATAAPGAGTGERASEGPPIERLLRLEGPQIFADNRAGTLRVDEPGRLVFADRRRADEPVGEGRDDVRGSALFTWKDSLLIDHAAGDAVMTGDVRMTHLRLGDSLRTTLVCDRLTARLAMPESAGSEADPELRSVHAEGAVEFTRDDRVLQADSVVYDPHEGFARATAEPGRLVRYLDPEQGAPQSARAFVWNLVTDEVRVSSPSPVTTPR